jgi:hypothetical protein
MEQKEPVEKKICRACLVEKPVTRFQKLASGNRGGVCNLCKSTGRTIKKDTISTKAKKKNIELNLGNVHRTDYITTYKFLQSIGYSLEGDIHEQFCERHNLKPRQPKRKFLNHYSQKDCGLI